MASQFQLVFLWCIILYSDQVPGLPVSPVQWSTEQWDSRIYTLHIFIKRKCQHLDHAMWLVPGWDQQSVSSDIDITQAPGPG